MLLLLLVGNLKSVNLDSVQAREEVMQDLFYIEEKEVPPTLNCALEQLMHNFFREEAHNLIDASQFWIVHNLKNFLEPCSKYVKMLTEAYPKYKENLKLSGKPFSFHNAALT
jgi:hypothetical protein